MTDDVKDDAKKDPVPATSDNPPQDTPPPITKEEEERRAAYEADRKKLFPELEEEEDLETLEEIKAERDQLRIEVFKASAKVSAENAKLIKQLAEQKEEAAGIQTRAARQLEEQKAFVLQKFIGEMLPVIDDMERGLASIPKATRAADPKFDKLAQGMEKTLAKLTSVFNKHGIREINPLGQPFDDARHEAISTRDEPDAAPETVVEVVQKGYELNSRVIRTAKVIVKP